MRFENDYVLRLIEELSGVVRQAMGKLQLLQKDEPFEVAGRAIGLALDMDPALASQLSPESVVSLLRLGEVDDRVVELVARSLELEAQAFEARGEASAAESRRAFAAEVRGAAIA